MFVITDNFVYKSWRNLFKTDMKHSPYQEIATALRSQSF